MVSESHMKSDFGDDRAQLIAANFIARPDVIAVQGQGGVYFPWRDRSRNLVPFNRERIEAHLSGSATYGHYVINGDSCKLFCFDIDLDKGWYGQYDCAAGDDGSMWNNRDIILDHDDPRRGRLIRRLRAVADGLAVGIKSEIGAKVAVSYSGSKGMHVYCLYGEAVSATRAVRDARKVMSRYVVKGNSRVGLSPKSTNSKYNQWGHAFTPGCTIEVFPKQTHVEPGRFGNLLRLPLGIHQKTGSPAFFIDITADPSELIPIAPERALA